MNAITDVWRDLVRRRLWPVALLLVAALVAVPLALTKHPEPVVTAVAPAGAATSAGPATGSYVELASDDTPGGKRRRVLGARKDPFEPAALPKVKRAKTPAEPAPTAAPEVPSTPAPPAPPAESGTGSAGGSGDAGPVAPVAMPTPAPKQKTYPLNSLKVRFGKTDGTMHTSTLEQLKALPSASSPVLVYTGLEAGRKTAVFMLTGDVTAEGDGACEPAPESCETLKLKAGETEFITVKDTGAATDGPYELDVEQIHTRTTASATTAKLHRATAATGPKSRPRKSKRASL